MAVWQNGSHFGKLDTISSVSSNPNLASEDLVSDYAEGLVSSDGAYQMVELLEGRGSLPGV